MGCIAWIRSSTSTNYLASGRPRYHNAAMHSLEESVKDFARSLAFSLVGIAPADAADGFERLTEWLERGYAGEMHYMHSQAEARCHPASILSTVRSVIMVGMEYGEKRGTRNAECGMEKVNQPPVAKIARYAAGPDYHD